MTEFESKLVESIKAGPKILAVVTSGGEYEVLSWKDEPSGLGLKKDAAVALGLRLVRYPQEMFLEGCTLEAEFVEEVE